MVCGMAWRGMSWYMKRHNITCSKLLPWAIVPFALGVGRCQLEVLLTGTGPFTSRGPFICMFCSHVQLLFSCSNGNMNAKE